jgi:polar amino acid transport system substrate-binding protein
MNAALRLSIASLLALGCSVVAAEPLTQGQEIKVCGQMAEWPPYLYFKRENGQRSEELVGYTIDYLQRSLAPHGLRYKFDALPWKRCLELVNRGLYDMLTDASYNPSRERSYLITKPYYALQLVYFYDKARPKPAIRTSADLKKYRVCTINGYNYSPFGLKQEEVYASSPGIEQSFQKLKHDRCDAVPERLEAIQGYKALGVVDYEQLGLGVEHLPDLPPATFHMMVSRKVAYGPELLAVLNEGIDKINRGPAAAEIAHKHGMPGVNLVPTQIKRKPR